MTELKRVERNQRVLVTLGRIGHELSTALEARVADQELTSNVPVMVICELAMRGPLRPRQLQASTGLTSGGVTRQVDRLERQGLVTRSYGTLAKDRRATVIELTADGLQLSHRLADAVSDRHDLLVDSFVQALRLLDT